MSGKWDDPSVPKLGWEFLYIDDLEEQSFICEMCEVQPIRYLHHMTHEDYGELDVGCICAGYMQGDRELAQRRETAFKLRAKRMMNWMGNWGVTKNWNYRKRAKGFLVVLVERNGLWSVWVKDEVNGTDEWLKAKHQVCEAAKRAAFDRIDPV